MMVQVVEQVALTIGAQGNTPLFCSLPFHGKKPFLAIHIPKTQATQFRDPNPGVIEQPENRPIPHCGSCCQWASFVRRGTSYQEPFKFLWLNPLDEWSANLWKGNQVKGILNEQATAYQPVKKGPDGASV